MIRLSVLYPTQDGYTFDHDYYRDSHIPLALKTWGLSEAEIDRGVDGPYVAAVHVKFESQDAVARAMSAPGIGDVLADVANYTNITPVIQTSEIVVG
ncbi:MAG TPA: EthD family reductase [Acidimicrobiales bacterium]|nr:EthD family reductase [Acidimicrobiales bacterium]